MQPPSKELDELPLASVVVSDSTPHSAVSKASRSVSLIAWSASQFGFMNSAERPPSSGTSVAMPYPYCSAKARLSRSMLAVGTVTSLGSGTTGM